MDRINGQRGQNRADGTLKISCVVLLLFVREVVVGEKEYIVLLKPFGTSSSFQSRYWSSTILRTRTETAANCSRSIGARQALEH